jgi:hypothetical protein
VTHPGGGRRGAPALARSVVVCAWTVAAARRTVRPDGWVAARRPPGAEQRGVEPRLPGDRLERLLLEQRQRAEQQDGHDDAHRSDGEAVCLGEQCGEDAAEAQRHKGHGEELEAVDGPAVAQPQRRGEADAGDDEAGAPQAAATAAGGSCCEVRRAAESDDPVEAQDAGLRSTSITAAPAGSARPRARRALPSSRVDESCDVPSVAAVVRGMASPESAPPVWTAFGGFVGVVSAVSRRHLG